MKYLFFILTVITLPAVAQYTNNDIVLIVGYGQSNAVGVAPQWYGGIDLSASKYNVTKIERDNVTGVYSFFKSQQYQTSTAEPTFARDRVSAFPMLGELMAQKILSDGVNAEVLLMNAAVNGAPMSTIYYNAIYYQILLRGIDSAKAYATRNGKNLKCAYVAFLHGESDATNNTNRYDTLLSALATHLNTDIKAKTGQVADIPLICTQLGFSYWSDLAGTYPARTMNICNYQIASLSNALIRMATPGYIAELEGQEFYTKNFQASHYSANGLRLLSGYIHKCWLASSWTSFTCTSATLTGNEITVTLTPITGSISIDATRICKDNASGFEFVDAGNAGIVITGITVLNSTQLKLTLSEVPTASLKTLYYAYSMNYSLNGLQYYRQNGALKDADNNYLLAFSKQIN